MTPKLGPRVLRAAAYLAVLPAVAGCSSTGASTTAVTAKGSILVVYLSAPPSPDAVQKQVLQAEQLACPSSPQTISGTSLSVKCQTVQQAKLSENARTAIQNESTIAYIGETQPGATEQSVGITNALDLAQLSPTDTALELTTKTSAVPGAPGKYYESTTTYGLTFARVVPTSGQEATAQVSQMKAAGVHAVYVVNDGSDYGKAIAAAVSQDAGAQGIQVRSSETAADAIFYGGNSLSSAAAWASKASSTATGEKLFLPSGLDALSLTAAPWSRFSSIYVSSPTATQGADKTFAAQFRSRFGSAPAPEAAFGYAAVQTVLHVVQEAGKSASNRAVVVRDLQKLSNFSTAVGPLSINSSGNSSLGPTNFSFVQVRSGVLVTAKHARRH